MTPVRPNPYSLAHPWSEETRSAHQSMPLLGGHVIALDYVEGKALESYEEAWRQWCKKTPRFLWPTWLEGWKDRKAMRK